MAYLFEIQGKIVQPTIEVLLIEPFKTIWENNEKEQSLKLFAYLEFFNSKQKTNPYKGYSAELRQRRLIEDLRLTKAEIEDPLIIQANEKIEILQKEASVTYSLYTSALKAKDELENFFNTLNMQDVNLKTGAPIYKPKEITSSLLELEKVIASLSALGKKVEEELFDSVKIRADKVISDFANPSSLNKK
jgi:hypothetical protein